jgi:hypothetical protein
VTEQELEQALRRALRPVDAGEDFQDRVLARLGAAATTTATATEAGRVPNAAMRATHHGRLGASGRWGLAALLAACVIAGIGLVRLRQEGLERQRGLEARAQLLEALNIASANVNAVRAIVIGAGH